MRKAKENTLIDTSAIKTGDILGVHKIKFAPVEMSIQRLTRHKVNHVAILMKYPNGNITVLEATLKGFKETQLTAYLKREANKDLSMCVVRPYRRNFKDPTKSISRAIEKTFGLLGKKYDKLAIVGFSFICLLKNLGINKIVKANWLQKKNKIFCSEAVCMAYHNNHRKVSLFVGEHDKEATCATISPGDIMKSKKVYYVTGDISLYNYKRGIK